MAEPIEMSFGLCTQVDPRKHMLDGNAHWRNLAHTIEPSMCGAMRPFCQITLTACLTFRNITAAGVFIPDAFYGNSDQFVELLFRIEFQAVLNVVSPKSSVIYNADGQLLPHDAVLAWYVKNKVLECGPMPNVMVALPNIGGALCSTPQSLADAHY